MYSRNQNEIIKNWPKKWNQPVVSIRCIAYNHEPYIVQTLEGFLMQNTSFPFEVVIHDDASTDRTADIIRDYEKRYPKIIKPIYEKENQYSKHDGSIGRVMNPLLKGKYIAFCEGDDYWIDANKLQKQVDYMNDHSECGLTYTKCFYFYQESQVLSNNSYGGPNEKFEDLIKLNTIPTATVLLKKELFDEYQNEIQPGLRNWVAADLAMWLWFSQKCCVRFMNFVSSVYRYLPDSASRSQSLEKDIAFKEGMVDIKSFFLYQYGTPMSEEKIVFCKNAIRLKSYATHCKFKMFFLLYFRMLTTNFFQMMSSRRIHLYFLFFFSKKLRDKHL